MVDSSLASFLRHLHCLSPPPVQSLSNEDTASEPLWTLDALRTIRLEVDRMLDQYSDDLVGPGAACSSSSNEASASKEDGDGDDRCAAGRPT